MKTRICLALLTVCALASCDDPASSPDAAVDASSGDADVSYPTCADPETTFAFPSPRFESDDGLVVPETGLTAETLRAEGWHTELAGMGGWPRRPTLIIPLDRDADTVDPTLVHVAESDGLGLRVNAVEMTVRLAGRRTLVVQPLDPFRYDTVEVAIALEDGVAGDAQPLGVCEAGAPHPAYATAAAAWPETADFALVMRLRLNDQAAAMVRTYERLATTPALTVLSSEAVDLADVDPELAPSTEDAVHYASQVLIGQLQLPEYRPAGGGPIAVAGDGSLMAAGVTEPGFVVALPATGTAPYPVVLFQHGGGGTPLHVLQVGVQLAEAGFAFVAIDLPEHGLRAGGMGGTELDFLRFDSPEATRENFRQTVADHLAVLTGLAAINDAIETDLGVAGALDPDRRFYMGMSLGGMSGSMTSAVARDLRGAALFVGGTGYPELMRHGLFAVLAAALLSGAEPRPSTLLAAVEAIGDGADPLAYAIIAEDREAAPTPMLFLQAVDDPLIAAEASDQWARAFGAALGRPSQHATRGLVELDLPAQDNFQYADDGPAATRILTHHPMDEISVVDRHGELIRTDYAQAMVTHCFASILETGSCEVVDTGFADR